MKLCAIVDGFWPLPLAAGSVIVTCEPSEYVMVVVVEPSELVTLWLWSPENGSLEELVENGSFGSLPPVDELAPPMPPRPW